MSKGNTSRTVLVVGFAFGLAASSALAQEADAGTIATNEPPKWDATANMGFSLTSGNSDTMLLTGSLIGNREFLEGRSKLELGIAGAYGEDSNVANVQTLRGWGQYNQDFAQRWYWLGRVEGFHDGIADIDYRLTLSPGIGYWILKQEQTRLSAEGGLSYVFERKGGSQNDYFALRLAERFEHDFNDKVQLWQDFEIFPQIDDLENYFFNFRIGIKSALSKKLSLDVMFIDNYVNQPAAGRKSNDVKFITGLSYKF